MLRFGNAIALCFIAGACYNRIKTAALWRYKPGTATEIARNLPFRKKIGFSLCYGK